MENQAEAAGPGAALRELRQRRGATLKDFAELTGFPISTLSKLENGKLGMSYQRLLKLSQSLDVDLTELIKVAPRAVKPKQGVATVTGRREITRASEGPRIKTQVYEYCYPASDLVQKVLNPIIVDVTARSIEEFDDLMRHPGEEYAFIIEGTVDFYSDHYRPTRLEKGDSIYFDSNMGHAYVAVGEVPCRVLSVCSAPLEDLIASRSVFEMNASTPPPAQILTMVPVSEQEDNFKRISIDDKRPLRKKSVVRS